MKLHYSPASPYVRKVRVPALETGLMGDIELAKSTLTPTGPDAKVCSDNPIGKIPSFFVIPTRVGVTPGPGSPHGSRSSPSGHR